jgi:hypothetical protein
MHIDHHWGKTSHTRPQLTSCVALGAHVSISQKRMASALLRTLVSWWAIACCTMFNGVPLTCVLPCQHTRVSTSLCLGTIAFSLPFWSILSGVPQNKVHDRVHRCVLWCPSLFQLIQTFIRVCRHTVSVFFCSQDDGCIKVSWLCSGLRSLTACHSPLCGGHGRRWQRSKHCCVAIHTRNGRVVVVDADIYWHALSISAGSSVAFTPSHPHSCPSATSGPVKIDSTTSEYHVRPNF